MSSEKEKITVKYQTQRETCHCCGQELSDLKTSNSREFDFSLQNIKEYAPWSRLDEEEMDEAVEEFVYNTIAFYATSHDDRIILFEGELERVHLYIKENFRKAQ